MRTGSTFTKIFNALGAVINPATEENQTNGTQKVQLVGSSGTVASITGENSLRVINQPYLYAVAEGDIFGHELFFALGYNADVDNTREDIWEGGGVYVFPPAGGIQMRLVSASANDAAAGTGIRTVQIDYLDSLYAPQTETVTLNGTTPVNTVATDILRIQHLHTETAGSGGLAAGNITLSNVAQTITYAMILANGNFSRNGIWTVPSGKTAYITGWQYSAGAAALGHNTEFSLRTTSDHKGNLSSGIFQFKRVTQVTDGGGFIPIESPIKIPATADIKVSAISDSGTANVIATTFIEGWIE